MKEVSQPTANSPKTNDLPTIGGVKLTSEQINILKEGGYIYLENMTNSKGQVYSAYIITDDKQQRAFMFKNRPDEFLKYGKYEMRAMDKRLIEAGCITKATVKWYGGGFAHPYLWKDNKSDSQYREAWSDPRMNKTEKIEKEENQRSAVAKIQQLMKKNPKPKIR